MEMVACAAHGTDHLGNPAGAATLAWTDLADRVHEQRVTRWLRFDRAGIKPGTIVTIEMAAQQRLDPLLPTLYAQTSILVTYDPTDTCEYAIGNPTDPTSWVFGMLCVGAILA